MINIRLKKEMHTPQGHEWLDLDLSFAPGEFVSIFGGSGAGKTTFLRLLAGLTRPKEGRIEVDGQVWFDSAQGIDLPTQQRKVGFVSQENCLFPHMTIIENLEFASDDKAGHDSISHWTRAMGLQGLENRRPEQISGGQKQRVALARALIREPKILLLDEPLSDLDSEARLNLQDEIIKVHGYTRTTTVLVSHDLPEVFKMSGKVFVIERGRIIRSGTPQEVFVKEGLSGKFKFTGQVIEILNDGVMNIVTLSIGNQLVKVLACDEEISGLAVGGKVIVAAKAFNPVIFKS